MIEPLSLLYVVSLHTSMAAMELFAWSLAAAALYCMIREGKFPRFPILLPAVGLVAAVVIGLLLHPEGRGFFFQLGFLRWLILLYLLPHALKRVWNEKYTRRLLGVWTGMVVIAGAYALFQTVTGIDLIRPNANVVAFEHGIYRPVGFFSRSLAFAYSFGFSFLAVALPSWRSQRRAWASLLVGVGTLTILATESRGAWLGFLVAIAFYLLLEHRRYLVLFVLLLYATVFALSHTQTDVGMKIQNLESMSFSNMSIDHSSSMRLDNWRAYWEMFKEHPLFGVGLQQGDLLVPAYYQKLGIQQDFVSNAHNVYLQWLAGGGIFALLFYLWICGYFLRRAWRLRHSTPWGWSILLAQIFLHVGAFTENNFFTAITNHMVIFNWSILLALGDPAERIAAGPKDSSTPSR